MERSTTSSTQAPLTQRQTQFLAQRSQISTWVWMLWHPGVEDHTPALQDQGCQQESGAEHTANCSGAHGSALGLRLHPNPADLAPGSLSRVQSRKNKVRFGAKCRARIQEEELVTRREVRDHFRISCEEEATQDSWILSKHFLLSQFPEGAPANPHLWPQVRSRN